MWTTALWEYGHPSLQWGAVIGASLAAAVLDAGTRRIPNRLTGPLFVAGLAASWWSGGLAGLADGAAASLLMAFPFLLLFLFAGGGAGDAKLMGALGAWLGVINGVVALLAVVLAGMALAISLALAKGRARAALANLRLAARGFLLFVASRGRLKEALSILPEVHTMQTIPYGVAIFAGTCIAGGGVLLWRA